MGNCVLVYCSNFSASFLRIYVLYSFQTRTLLVTLGPSAYVGEEKVGMTRETSATKRWRGRCEGISPEKATPVADIEPDPPWRRGRHGFVHAR